MEESNNEKYKKITKNKKIHSILTYKIRQENGVIKSGCHNRDFNATMNMLNIVNKHINKQDIGIFKRTSIIKQA